MTLENSKRLLAHYEKTGNTEAALDMREAIKRRGGDTPKKTAKKE